MTGIDGNNINKISQFLNTSDPKYDGDSSKSHWILDYLNSNSFRTQSMISFGQMLKDSLLTIGDPQYIRNIAPSLRSCTMTRNLLGEINSIIGILSSEPRCTEVLLDNSDEDEHAKQLQEDLNRKIYSTEFNLFDQALGCLKDRLTFGVGYTYYYINKLSGKVECKKLSPLQCYEYPYENFVGQSSSSSGGYVSIFEDLESDQFASIQYGINYDRLLELKRKQGKEFYTFLDNQYKTFLINSYISDFENTSDDEFNSSTESIVTYTPSLDKYKRVQVPSEGFSSTRVVHCFIPSIQKEKILTDGDIPIITGKMITMHYVIIGNEIVFDEVLYHNPLVKLGKKVIDSDCSYYGYRALSYNCMGLLISYNAVLSCMTLAAINSPAQKLLVKKGSFSRDSNRPLDLQQTVIPVSNMTSDDSINQVVYPINMPIVDANCIQTLNWLDTQIRLSCGLIDMNKVTLSGEHELLRLNIQQSSLKPYSLEIEEFLKESTLAILNLMILNESYSDILDDGVIVRVVLTPDSQSYKKSELSKIMQLSRLTGGAISISLKNIATLLDMDERTTKMVLDGEEKDQETRGQIQSEAIDAKTEQLKADAVLKLASAKEKLAKSNEINKYLKKGVKNGNKK
ncbi:MAG: hypothetical protein ACRCXT_00480 [Paraclostridium sp.]